MNVTVCEVGPRDGLQNEPETLAPRSRAELISRLSRAGFPRIEAVSFVSPTRVPQMADAEDVLALSETAPNVVYAGLVLNERGYQRLRDTVCRQVNVAFCVTESFNQRNQGRSVAQSVQEAARMVAAARADGRRTTVTLAASFGCPFEGRVDRGRVLAMAEAIAAAGPDEIVFADTIGVGTPGNVRRMVQDALRLEVPLGLHLHNTRNTGYANAYAAIEAGASTLDASVGGLGGCPFAPNATGNIATEDLLYLLDEEGIDAGVDIDQVIRTAEWLEGVLGRRLPGQVYRAGRFAQPTPTR
ncbi:MAG: hydroxymethylglutaryl-CoA lyase [Haloechinothrix sp.]